LKLKHKKKKQKQNKTNKDKMKRKQRDEDYFGFEPTTIVNDFNQTANDYCADQMDSLENFLQNNNDLKTNEKKEIKKVIF